MSEPGYAQKRFERYIKQANRRETWRLVLVFLVCILGGLIAVTALGSGLGIHRGFSEALTVGIRLLLLLTVILGLVFLLWRPIGKLWGDGGAALIESADAAFDGRVQTFIDTDRNQPEHGFLPLLARDGLSVAKRVPIWRIVSSSALLWPIALSAVLIAGVIGFFQKAPENMQNAALHIWWGWQDKTLVEDRRIAVLPGDIELLSGENLEFEVELTGFARESVSLNVFSGEDNSSNTLITRSPDGRFRFTMFRVSEPLRYSVDADFVESEEFTVSVLQPARLQQIDALYQYPEWTRLEPYTLIQLPTLATYLLSKTLVLN